MNQPGFPPSFLQRATSAPPAEPGADDSATPPLSVKRRRSGLAPVFLILALFYTAFLARDLIVPVVLALFLALCGNPILTWLQRFYVPRWLGALVLILGGALAAGYATSLMLAPASEWVRRAPEELREHLPRLRALAKPLEDANRATASIEELTTVGPPAPRPALVRVVNPLDRNVVTVLAGAPRTLASVFAVLILSYFFLVYGNDLVRRFIALLSGWRRKRLTVDIAHAIQTDLSHYVLTITLINIAFGLAAAGMLWLIGLDASEALFWGAVAGALNFAPYIGPLATFVAYVLIGLVEFNTLEQALLVPGALLLLHVIEGQFVTPLALGRRFAISPLILVLWLFLWGWMWGIAGLLLAVPMLVCLKICFERIESLKSWANLLETGYDAAPHADA